ncbi:MAG: nucleotidyltransferase [Kiritimatiellaeota bacterium]|nr:nucleotidyltransferase [Kiritimatiellota bacterium]
MDTEVAPALVILAAGLGSRFGGWKQIEAVGPSGEIVLDYSVYDGWRAGFGRVVFIVREEIQAAVRDHFDRVLAGRIETAYVVQRLDDLPPGFDLPSERRKPWGTAHAVWSARREIDRPFAVINADDFYGPESYAVLAAFLKDANPAALPAEFAMVGFPLRNTLSPNGTVSRGICAVNPDGALEQVVERTKIRGAGDKDAEYLDGAVWRPLSGDAVASMNMWGFTPSLLARIEPLFAHFLRSSQDDPGAEFFLPALVDALVRAGKCRVTVLATPAKWFGITYAADLEDARRSIRRQTEAGRYPTPLWEK